MIHGVDCDDVVDPLAAVHVLHAVAATAASSRFLLLLPLRRIRLVRMSSFAAVLSIERERVCVCVCVRCPVLYCFVLFLVSRKDVKERSPPILVEVG